MSQCEVHNWQRTGCLPVVRILSIAKSSVEHLPEETQKSLMLGTANSWQRTDCLAAAQRMLCIANALQAMKRVPAGATALQRLDASGSTVSAAGCLPRGCEPTLHALIAARASLQHIFDSLRRCSSQQCTQGASAFYNHAALRCAECPRLGSIGVCQRGHCNNMDLYCWLPASSAACCVHRMRRTRP